MPDEKDQLDRLPHRFGNHSAFGRDLRPSRITDHNTRLIVAVLGLIYTTLAGGLLYLAAMQSAAMLEHEFRFMSFWRTQTPRCPTAQLS
jgi:hypothetical protein